MDKSFLWVVLNVQESNRTPKSLVPRRQQDMSEVVQVSLRPETLEASEAEQVTSRRNIPSGAYKAALGELLRLVPEKVDDPIYHLLLYSWG